MVLTSFHPSDRAQNKATLFLKEALVVKANLLAAGCTHEVGGRTCTIESWSFSVITACLSQVFLFHG